ncbi:putative transposase [Shigella sonnei 4822-66]|nr:putative transposase [Shigella sonnei 4822-66]
MGWQKCSGIKRSYLGYRSPREYLRQRACNGLSDNRCLEI